MKKIICIIIILTVLLTGCSVSQADKHKENTVSTQADISNGQSKPLLNKLDFHGLNSFTVTEFLGGKYYGFTTEYDNNGQLVNTEYLSGTNISQTISYPSGLPDWTVASGSATVLQNRYYYEWKSYTSEFSESALHDVRLTRTDGKTGKVEVIDEVNQSIPFVYLCKINDTQFLSYTVLKGVSDETEYSTVTTATVYKTDGSKSEIIKEVFENNAGWADSKGVLIERFAVNGEELYGFGRRKISGEYKFFLYHYDLSGNLIKTIPVNGFEDIIKEEQPVEFIFIGDYIAIKTFETLTTYICEINGSDIRLVAEGTDGKIQYAVSDNYIFFIENNVDVYTGEILQKECPLYVIDVSNGKTHTVNFEIPLDEPYFVSIKALSNGELILEYCENGEYDPMKKHQFVINENNITQLIANR